jgi:hypothetical protein
LWLYFGVGAKLQRGRDLHQYIITKIDADVDLLPHSLSKKHLQFTTRTAFQTRQKMERDDDHDDIDGQLNPFNDVPPAAGGPLPPSLPMPPPEEQQRALHNEGYRDGAAAGHALGLQQGFDEGFDKGIEAGEALGRLLGAAR